MEELKEWNYKVGVKLNTELRNCIFQHYLMYEILCTKPKRRGSVIPEAEVLRMVFVVYIHNFWDFFF